MRSIILIGFSLLLLTKSIAQDTISVATFCHSYGDSIAVRWQPYSKTGWIIGKDNGYKLVRLAYSGGDLVETKEVGIFKFLPQSKWQNLLQNNTYATLPYQAAYDYESPITDLNNINNVLSKNKEEENIFIFNLLYANFDFEVATAMGLGYMDKDIKRGFRYQYMIAYVDSKSYVQTTPLIAEVAAYSKNKLPIIDSLDIETEDSRATLRWNFIDFESKYVAYFIGRSSDGGKNFVQVNNTPFVPLVDDIYGDPDTRYIYFNDDSLTNNMTYHYRIRGVSYFGDTGLPSNIVAGTPKSGPISAEPIITDVWENEEGNFKISWFFDSTFLDQIKYFEVYKSDGQSSPHKKISYQKIYADQPLVFIDSFPNVINFYKIKAIDKNDHERNSISVLGQLQDNTPPLPPINIEGIYDTTGIIKISWSGNTESDLSGYFVYASNIEKGDYSILTRSGSVKDTFFLDTVGLNRANERIYYKLVALDFRGNQSDFSKTILVKLPDRWPPVKPVFKRHQTQTGKLFLEWTNSSSYDISHNVLERKIQDSLLWQPLVIDSTRGTTVNYLDSLVDYKNKYQYRIRAVDDDNLFSYSDTLILQPIDDRQRSIISNFTLSHSNKRTVKLSWDLNTPIDQIKKITIFRGTENKLVIPYETIYDFNDEIKANTFIDQNIPPNKIYTYKVIIRLKNGSFSASELKQINTFDGAN